MLDFIKQYWLEVLFSGILGIFSIVAKAVYSKFKRELKEYTTKQEKESQEQALLRAGVIALLHDRIYTLCQEYLKQGEITMGDLDNLGMLYNSYHSIGGNGTGTQLYERCCKLRIRGGSDAEEA